MSDINDEFRSWMDGRKLRADAVGAALDVSAQTIRNWRSSRIPGRKHDAVRRIMREWDTNPSTRIGQRLSIDATDEEFRAWNQAALDEGKLIEDWVRDGLHELAIEYFNNPQLSLPLRPGPKLLNKGADEEVKYRTKTDSGNS